MLAHRHHVRARRLVSRDVEPGEDQQRSQGRLVPDVHQGYEVERRPAVGGQGILVEGQGIVVEAGTEPGAENEPTVGDQAPSGEEPAKVKVKKKLETSDPWIEPAEDSEQG